MQLTKKFLLGAAALSALAGSAQAQQVRVAGIARGCFFLWSSGPCATYSTGPISSAAALPGTSLVFDADLFLSGLSFDDYTSVDGQLAVGGALGAVFPAQNFGKFTLPAVSQNFGGTVINNLGNLGFALQLEFVDPTGIPVGGTGTQPIIARISGNTTGSGGGISVDFDNSLQGPFAFATSTIFPGPIGNGPSGSLIAFRVKDQSINAGQVSSISGDIVVELATVPEPATVALMATGLLGVMGAGVLRRRSAV
jgi:hypothetical protein